MSTDDDSGRVPAPPANPGYRVAMDARFVWFLVGSAGLLALASCWFLLSFTPNGLGLGFAISHNSKSHRSTEAAAAEPTNSPSDTTTATSFSAPAATSSATRSAAPTSSPAVSATSAAVQTVLDQGRGFVSAPPLTTAASAPSSVDPTATGAPTSSAVVLPPPVTTSTSPTPTDTTTAPTVPPTTPAPIPDTLPVNAPGSPVQVDTMAFGTDDAARTLTVTGLRLSGAAADPMSVIDWGDGVVEPLPLALPADLSHVYTADGPVQIVIRAADGSGIWAHTVTVSATPLTAPAPTLGYDATAVDQDLTLVDPSLDIWSAWTLDYGDGSLIAAGTEGQPSSTQMEHTYDGDGHTARLTVVGPDGQLSTTAIATP